MIKTVILCSNHFILGKPWSAGPATIFFCWSSLTVGVKRSGQSFFNPSIFRIIIITYSWLHSSTVGSKKDLGSNAGLGSFRMEFAYSPVHRLPPIVQKYEF